jgi:hypothetical protein
VIHRVVHVTVHVVVRYDGAGAVHAGAPPVPFSVRGVARAVETDEPPKALVGPRDHVHVALGTALVTDEVIWCVAAGDLHFFLFFLLTFNFIFFVMCGDNSPKKVNERSTFFFP